MTDAMQDYADTINSQPAYDGSTPNWDGSEEQARKHYDFTPQMAQAFGSFENYMAYLQEHQAARAANVAANQQAMIDDPLQNEIANTQGGLMGWYGAQVAAGNDPNAMLEGGSLMQAQESWNQLNQELWDKYTNGSVSMDSFTDEKGDKYTWNGTSFNRYEQGSDQGWDLFSSLLTSAATGILGAGIAPAIAGSLGVTSATGIGAIQGATGATLGGAIAGDIDPKSILIAAAMGGLNPGGTLSNQLGVSPDSFAGGFIGGGVNTLVGDGLRTGDLDLQNALTSGLIQGGINSVSNLIQNINGNSPEALMESEAARHEADYKRANGGSLEGYVPLTETQLFDLAMANPLVNKSNLGALVGEGGLLPFIPELPLEGLINLKELLLGHQDGTSLFLGPNGNYLTHAELIAAGQDPVSVFQATLGGGPGIDGYTHAGYVDNPPSLIDKITGKITELVNQTPLGPAIGGMMDAAAAEAFKNQYGFYAADDPTLAQQVVAYGPLEENYSYADNPRGNSEMFGTTYTNGNYTQGLQTLIDAATGTRSAITVTADQIAAVNEAGDAAREQQQQLLNNGYIINLGDEPLQTLPGAENNAFWEQFLASFNNNGAEEVASTAPGDTTTLPGSDIPFEVGDEVTDEVDDSVDNSVDNNTNVVVDDTNTQTDLPSNPNYRRNQITEMLGSTIASLPAQLPASSTPTLPGIDPRSNPNNGVNPEWGDLYKYKQLEKWKKARDRQYAGIAGLLQQQGNPLNSTKRKYTQRQKSDMGLLS